MVEDFSNQWYSGEVIHGLQNGRKFGFPTANVQSETTPNIGKGVYAVLVRLGQEEFKGMLYVGTRPTLNLSMLSFEINIHDFDRDIYGEILSYQIVKKIRDEKKFNSPTELIEQLKKDHLAVEAEFIES